MQKKLAIGSALLAGLFFSKDYKPKCCGIIGILSEKRDNIGKSLTTGVELLKNRGYDSAGIVTFSQENGIVQEKLIKQAEEANQTANCIDRLVNIVSQKIIRSHIGIGHTRWATCGAKVEKNAHPHFDESNSIYIVHNGIISGHSVIKKQYLSNVKFNSETDSQVIAQLLGKFRTEGSTMLEAIKKTQQILKATCDKPQWGIVIMDKRQPHKMWTSTNGSPILIGITKDQKQIYVASQLIAIAFQKDADCYFVTGDGQNFQLNISSISQLKKKLLSQNRLKYISKQDKAGISVTPPQPFKSWYSYQIQQQGQIKFNPEFQRVKALNFGPFLSMIACGSSMYAAQTAQYFFKKLNTFVKVCIYDPVQMLENDIAKEETVVLISQSGETKDLTNVVEKCKKIEGVRTIGIINVEGSTLARMVDFPIYIKVGREVSVGATKSMFHQTLNLIMLAVQIATKKNTINQQILNKMKSQLLSIPEKAHEVIKSTRQKCFEIAKLIHSKSSIYLLAMREAMPIAKQSALKIKQLTYIHAEALGACEMKHGPIALIQSDKPKETTVILFILDNQTFEQCVNAYDQMNSRNAFVIIVTDCAQRILKHYETKKKEKESKEGKKEEENIQLKNSFTFLTVPKLQFFSSVLTLIPMQILVQQICLIKNYNPDMPRNLAKTVTV